MSQSTRECVVLSDAIEQQLRAFGKLPKQLKVVVKETRYNDGHVSNYALVKVCAGDIGVIVPYEILRKLVQKLKGQHIETKVSQDGVQLVYNGGTLFLKHIGEVDDVVELYIGA